MNKLHKVDWRENNLIDKKIVVESYKKFFNDTVRIFNVNNKKDLEKLCCIMRGCLEICEYENELKVKEEVKNFE